MKNDSMLDALHHVTMQIRMLEAERKEIIDILQDSIALGEYDLSDGKLLYKDMVVTPSTRQSWSYSSQTKKAIKKMQEVEQLNGLAERKETRFLRVTFQEAMAS